MRDLSCADITALVRDLCIQANCNLPDDVRCAICAAREREQSPVCLLYTSDAADE